MILCLSAIESIANMQYLNIKHSEMALNAYSGASSSLIPNWIADFNTLNKDHIVFNFGIFEESEMSALFLDNYGDSLTEIMAYTAIFLIAAMFAVCKSKETLATSYIGRAYSIAVGLFLSNAFGQIQSQVLFGMIQLLKTSLLVDPYSICSYVVAWITLSSAFGVQIFCFVKLSEIFSFKEKSNMKQFASNTKEKEDSARRAKWMELKYEMLFDSFEDDSKNQFFFSSWLGAYDTAYALIILCFQSVPSIQCLLIVVLLVCLIMFAVIVRPMKEKIASFIFFFNFGSTLVLAIVNMFLAISDAVNTQLSETAHDALGKTVFAVTMTNTGVNLLIGFGGMAVALFSAIKKWGKKGKKPNERSTGHQKRKIRKERNFDESNEFQEQIPALDHSPLSSGQIKIAETARQSQIRQPQAVRSLTMNHIKIDPSKVTYREMGIPRQPEKSVPRQSERASLRQPEENVLYIKHCCSGRGHLGRNEPDFSKACKA